MNSDVLFIPTSGQASPAALFCPRKGRRKRIRVPANPLYFWNRTKNLTPFWNLYYMRQGAQLALLESCSDQNDPACCDYDAGWYEANLIKTYGSMLKKGLHPAAYWQLFTRPRQPGLFDLPLERLQPRRSALE